ncbi:S-layer homology domain-containing protein [Thermolongibacillus altinsuensis]|jgi:hypothetical protein|uniref:S-layer homology domain-containing protein n=1 Tax=Thermolongibacillus altinsuensis TaxID=575256 RepID=UPI00242A322F|nr:S-layer homology domain-containing protein [Thermolongibacillus altinsuensis]GMB09155.1 hypothetical protein B1no1_18650 [Thermolongibacillus altinsuensis]
MKKKIVLLCFILSLVFAPLMQVQAVSFKDVNKQTFGEKEILTLANRGIIGGYPDGTFRPKDLLERRHIAILLARAMKYPQPKKLTYFKDVPSSHINAKEFAQMYEQGIFKGSNGYFGPKQLITREQMATVLVRVFHLEDTGEKVTFKDMSSISPSHVKDVKILKQHGITEADVFNPKGYVTRAHFAVFLYRALAQQEAPEVVSIQ